MTAHRPAPVLVTCALVCAAGAAVAPPAASAASRPATPSTSPAALAAAAAEGGGGVSHAQNPRVPEGALWSEAYFPSSDRSGVVLHADVLRPERLSRSAKTPVIVSVGPYFSHRGQIGDQGFDRVGPSDRFHDLIEGAELMRRGYTVVLVDLRGFGGSTGCLDWVGPGEQADVRAAVSWASRQPWSTGKVGMYGKSYDASTGLVAANQQVPGLSAVVAQEPVWNMYNYLFSNGVPRPNHRATPRAYNEIAKIAPMRDDSPRYQAAARYEKSHPDCLQRNLTETQDPSPTSAYWRARNLAAMAKDSTVPLFVTQGFLEPNTKPEDMELYLNNHKGVKRAWLGQWNHVRGNDRDGFGRLLMGRAGWFQEVMRFYDRQLKGVVSPVSDPAIALEDSTGAWRAQTSWPQVDRATTVRLRSGSYRDVGLARPGASLTAPQGGDTEHPVPLSPAALEESTTSALSAQAAAERVLLTWSRPVSAPVRVTGTPRVSLRTSGSGNVLVRLWDVAPGGRATLITEQMSLVRSGRTAFDLKSTDWLLSPGHQLMVGVGTNQSGQWADSPSDEKITVSSASLSLDLQNPSDDVPTQGKRSPWLKVYRSIFSRPQGGGQEGTFTVWAPRQG